MHNTSPLCSRRQMLKSSACGFGYLAAAGMAQSQARAGIVNPLLARKPQFAPRAKRVIFIFMQGGPSHVDTFDYKPVLAEQNGTMREFDDARVLAKTKSIKKHRVYESPWRFRRFGECGQYVSDLFPHIAQHVDDLCFLKGMHTNGVAHGPATLFMHTGSINLVRPSVGSWVLYGLGTENQNLPGFISIQPSMGNGGPRNYSNAFLNAVLPRHTPSVALAHRLPTCEHCETLATQLLSSKPNKKNNLICCEPLNAQQTKPQVGLRTKNSNAVIQFLRTRLANAACMRLTFWTYEQRAQTHRTAMYGIDRRRRPTTSDVNA